VPAKTWIRRTCENLLVATGSTAFGVGVMASCQWMEQGSHRAILTGYDHLWEHILIVSVALASPVFGFAAPTLCWMWPLLMAYGFYFAGFVLLKHWGQIPPLELIWMTGMALPGVLTGFLGAWARLSMRRASLAAVQTGTEEECL
jgi:hypothetical protein